MQTWRGRGAAGLPWARPRGRELDEGVHGRTEPGIRRMDADAVVTGGDEAGARVNGKHVWVR
jgi:hypothetical protein